MDTGTVLTTKEFWVAATERAVKTGAQSSILVIGADQINALNADWINVLGFFLGGLVLSYLTSLISAPVSGNGPSLVKEEQLAIDNATISTDGETKRYQPPSTGL